MAPSCRGRASVRGVVDRRIGRFAGNRDGADLGLEVGAVRRSDSAVHVARMVISPDSTAKTRKSSPSSKQARSSSSRSPTDVQSLLTSFRLRHIGPDHMGSVTGQAESTTPSPKTFDRYSSSRFASFIFKPRPYYPLARLIIQVEMITI